MSRQWVVVNQMAGSLQLYGESFTSRFLLGTAQYASPDIMSAAIAAAECEIVTVALRRQAPKDNSGDIFWQFIRDSGCKILPNTAGCRSVKEAITTAEMSRELFETDWLKLEVIGDDYNLQPDPFGLVIAAEQLIKNGFNILPYCTDDLILCQRLLDVGCQVLMPWGAPIGTGLGLLNKYQLASLRERLPNVPLIIDAGLGTPSQACEAMEMGFDAVLLNTAVAKSQQPVSMASAFAKAIVAGRSAYLAGPIEQRQTASPSTPTIGQPFWHQQ